MTSSNKACFVVDDRDRHALERATGLTERIVVQFNPTEYKRGQRPKIPKFKSPQRQTPDQSFGHGEGEVLSLELLFDTTTFKSEDDPFDVRDLTDPLFQLAKNLPERHAPPRLKFIWGQMAFPCVVASVQQHFKIFSQDGIPLRANVSLTLREYVTPKDELAGKNPKSPDQTKARLVQRGDRLDVVAYEEYGDAALWRVIADANPELGTEPRRLSPGMVLRLPVLDAAARRAVEQP